MDIGRDLLALFFSGAAFAAAMIAWFRANRCAAKAERRLTVLEQRTEGPTAREICADLSEIITPYRDRAIGRPIREELPAERRFLRNLRLQLRRSRQRRIHIEALHAENATQWSEVRAELNAWREAQTAQSLHAPSAPPETTAPLDDDVSLVLDAIDDAAEQSQGGAAVAMPVDSAFTMDAIVEADFPVMPIDVAAMPADPIDFDSLLADSAAALGVDIVDAEHLGGMEAFERRLAEHEASASTEIEGDDLCSEHADSREPSTSGPQQTAEELSARSAEVSNAIAALSGIIERAEMSRASLASLDASLTAQLDQRRDLVNRIDSALNDRQMHLVTDILRAESERRALGEAVERVAATIDAIRTDVAQAVGADALESHRAGTAEIA